MIALADCNTIFCFIGHSNLGAREGDSKSLPRGEGFRVGVT